MNMDEELNSLGDFWDSILSQQPKLIENAFVLLLEDEQQIVIAHLIQMCSEEGWLPMQRLSASTALQVIDSIQTCR